jgi:very-short-patch-repair endonuclease
MIRNRQLVVEIDGMGHLMAEVLIDDGWRANELLIQGTPVLRISSLALKLNPDPFFEQLQLLFEKAA